MVAKNSGLCYTCVMEHRKKWAGGRIMNDMKEKALIFDSHAHYDDERFDDDRDELLLSMKKQGVGMIVNVGASLESTRQSVKLAEQYDFMYASVGIHPSEIKDLNDLVMEELRQLVMKEKVVAIGEIGLDYYYMEDGKEEQIYWFERQLELARELKMPVIIHSRDAAADTMKIMGKYANQLTGGVIHCYSYSVEQAKEYVKMGFYIGVGGVLTFKNGRKLVETVQAIPLERIVLETDCPYLSPVPNRGKRNDSSNIKYVVQKLAELKGCTEEEVIVATSDNAHKLYHIRGGKL